MIYSVTEIIGKTLFPASQPVKLYRTPDVKSPVIFTVNPGTGLGIVFSYVQRPDGIYWQFTDGNGRPYFAKHEPGRFSLTALRQQGAQSTIEKIKEDQQAKPMSWQTVALLVGLGISVAVGSRFL
ncbi:MAG: hypothetical protein VKL39_21705 [Leptolyngbyaceae bacterium]|nr:hypothetical protein [Leptolyngbyaceae bacterium]